LKKDVGIAGGTDKIIIRDRNQEAIYKNGPSFRGDEIGIKKKFFFNKNYVYSMAHDVVASRELIIKYDRSSSRLLDWEGLWVYTNSPMVAPGISWVPVERVSLWPFLDGDINQYNYAIYCNSDLHLMGWWGEYRSYDILLPEFIARMGVTSLGYMPDNINDFRGHKRKMILYSCETSSFTEIENILDSPVWYPPAPTLDYNNDDNL